ncbi:MAG: hypothetical protein ABIG91_03360, partial [Patescibacteria group bacterium]
MYIVIVLNFFADCFFDGHFGQFGAIRVEYNQGGHLRFIKSSFHQGRTGKISTRDYLCLKHSFSIVLKVVLPLVV